MHIGFDSCSCLTAFDVFNPTANRFRFKGNRGKRRAGGIRIDAIGRIRHNPGMKSEPANDATAGESPEILTDALQASFSRREHLKIRHAAAVRKIPKSRLLRSWCLPHIEQLPDPPEASE